MSVKKYVVEFIGTFFLVLTIGCVVIGGGKDLGAVAPIAIGGGLMVMIFAGGHVSGAHFNPAVTLGVFLRGKCPIADVIPYIVAQVLAAAAAAGAATYLHGFPADDAMDLSTKVPQALLAEVLFTFALVWVILNTATADSTSGNSFYGLAIGFTVLAGAYSVGSVSGGAFNPAVAIGISIMKLTAWKNLWIYLVANFGGAAAAAAVFKFTNGPDEPKG